MTCAMLAAGPVGEEGGEHADAHAAITVPLSWPTPPATTTRNAGMM